MRYEGNMTREAVFTNEAILALTGISAELPELNSKQD
jgi:hypothetical protein